MTTAFPANYPRKPLLHILKMRLNFEQTKMAASSVLFGHTTLLQIVTVIAIFSFQIMNSDSGIPSKAGMVTFCIFIRCFPSKQDLYSNS